MITASICTIGDEILIGQVTDTNSGQLAWALEETGVQVKRMVSVGDERAEILEVLRKELKENDIVITTGGLGPTKDDITKAVLAELSGSTRMVEHAGQLEMVIRILHGRGLDVLPANRAQALVPEKADVIVNQLGTAPIMVFRNLEGGASLYALPGVPHEAVGAIPAVLEDIRAHYPLLPILHRNLMVYGIAESALSALIAPWEDALPADMHLAYLPHPLTGIRLRLSIYGDADGKGAQRIDAAWDQLKKLLGDKVYAQKDSSLEEAIGEMLIQRIEEQFFDGVVSAEVAAAMAEGVRALTGSDYAVATTGLAGPGGDEHNPVGTVWIGVSGPGGTRTISHCFKHDRKRNIERFAASALDFLRKMLVSDLIADTQ